MDLFIAAEVSKPKRLISKQDLMPIHNLKIIFRDIRDYFVGNVTGITRDEKIAQNIMRLPLCKIYDEKYSEGEEIVSFANRPNEELSAFKARMSELFEKVKHLYKDIFEDTEELEIQAFDLLFIVSKMEDYAILGADRDIIADAFEELIGTSFRGGEGQFFTPRNIVQMMIDISQPQSGERIIDPACGSGGFIAHILPHLLKNNAENYFLSGIDKDLFLSKLAKIYLTILGENEYHIFCENSLEIPKNWKQDTQGFMGLGSFDLILANPPFGSKFYGTGSIPFVRTTDIVNWEMKINLAKSVAEEIYWQYQKAQDIRENDILFVNDGTFLIGRSAMVMELDVKCIIQSHLKKIRVLKPEVMSPFYLFNAKIVQRQIEMLTFIQATLSTLGNRMTDVYLPIHKDKAKIAEIAEEVQSIIKVKKDIKFRANQLIENSL